ncbi:MAG: hypothetical protein ACRDST_20600 [Pseudonocardiaceae bacterium]
MTLSFAEIDSQHVELLPARTVMSLFTLGSGKDSNGGGDGGPVSCVVSIGQLSVALGVLLAGGAADGTGSSCNSIG